MSARHTGLLIGEVAATAGLSVDAVRYYERLGLLAPEARTGGGFRTYGERCVERLAFIKQAQRLGLRLKEIRALVHPLHGAGRSHCQQVQAVIVQRLADVEVQMAELKTFRRTLRSALSECEHALRSEQVDECPVVRSLAPAPTRSRRSRS